MKINLKQLKTDFLEHIKSDKFKEIKGFLLIILGYGVLINYSLLIIFNVPFKWYGFPAFGIVYYFIMEEFTAWFRKLKAKKFE